MLIVVLNFLSDSFLDYEVSCIDQGKHDQTPLVFSFYLMIWYPFQQFTILAIWPQNTFLIIHGDYMDHYLEKLGNQKSL